YSWKSLAILHVAKSSVPDSGWVGETDTPGVRPAAEELCRSLQEVRRSIDSDTIERFITGVRRHRGQLERDGLSGRGRPPGHPVRPGARGISRYPARSNSDEAGRGEATSRSSRRSVCTRRRTRGNADDGDESDRTLGRRAASHGPASAPDIGRVEADT